MKHPIDKFFREKLEEREFEFNPSDWQKAKAMLDVQPNKRRRILWIFILVGLLVAALSYAYLLEDQEDNSSENIQYAVDTSPSPDNEDMTPAAIPPTSQTPNAPWLKSVKDVAKQDALSSSSGLTGASIYNLENNSNKDQSKTHTTPNIPFIKDHTLADPGINETKYLPNDPRDIPKDESIEETTSLQNSFTNDLENKIILGINDIESNNPGAKAWPGDESMFPIDQKKIKAIAIDKLSFKPFNQNHQSRFPKPLDKIILLTKPVSPTSFNGLGLSYVSVIQPLYNGDSKRWRGQSLNIFYIKSLSPSLGLYFGLGGKYVNGDFPITQSAERFNQSNGFNFRREILQLKPDGVYYASIPVQIRKRIGRHQLAAGLEMNKVLWVRAQKLIQTYDQNRLIGQSIDSARPETQSASAVWMATSSFNQIQWQGLIGYRYLFNNRMSLGVSTNYMINKIITSDTEALMPETEKFFMNLSFEVNLWKL